MGDKRNYAALEWVIGEIGETLNDARQALEAFVEDPRDTARIRFCLTHIHQVHGSLQMVEFHGASLFAEEMEALAQALMHGKVVNEKEAQEVLMRSLLQLPHYLEQVKNYHDDHPGIVLPLLNDIRAVRKQSYLSETNLFNPDLTSVNEVTGSRHSILSDANKLREVVKKLREMYQYAAASVLRGLKIDENLSFIDKVFVRLEGITRGTRAYPLWQVSAALAEALARDDIELSVAVRGLMRQLARELRTLEEHCPQVLDAPVQEPLLRNLLFYVARAEDGGRRVAQVKEQYALESALFGGATERSKANQGMISAPEPGAIRAVVVALQDELNTTKHLMNLAISGQGGLSDLEEMLPIVKRIGDTLAVLGIGDMRKLTIDQYDILQKMTQSGAMSDTVLIDVAGRLADIEHRLEAIAKGAGKHHDYANVDEREVEIDSAKEAVLNECRAGLERVKETIVEALSAQWNPTHLPNAIATIRDIEGGLNMVPLTRSANILGLCGRYIEEQLSAREDSPGEELQVLADAIASIDYYLERLAGAHGEELESYLDLAEESLAQLGYTLDKSSAKKEAAESGAAEFEPPAQEASQASAAVTAISDAVAANEELDQADDSQSTPVADEPETSAEESFELQASLEDEAEQEAVELTDVEQPEVLAEPSDEQDLAEPEATAEAVASISVDTTAQLPSEKQAFNEDDIDQEIVDIFIEEAGEVQETLKEYFPKWTSNLDDTESLTVVRRAFHTLKGSGRMVEAMDVGELAWAVESMLNRVMDATVPAHVAHTRLIERVLAFLPSLITAFKDRQPNPDKTKWLQLEAFANALAKGDIPRELAGIGYFEDVAPPTEIDESAASDMEDATEAPVEEAIAVADVAVEEPEEEDEDQLLWDIFSSEAETHLAVVDEFLSNMAAAAPLYMPPTDGLQSALHTLKGSAHMAGVTPIALMITPLEGFFKELRSYQVKVDKGILQLLTDAAAYTREGLECISKREPVVIAEQESFIARVSEEYERLLAPLIHSKDPATVEEARRRVDPKLLALFMSEEMSLLLDADEYIDKWRDNIATLNSDIEPMRKELATLEQGAKQANLPLMSDLSAQLGSIYGALGEGSLAANDALFEVLKPAHEKLLDMVDQIAAGQNIAPLEPSLAEALRQLLEGAPSSATAPEVDAEASAETIEAELLAREEAGEQIDAEHAEDADYEEADLQGEQFGVELSEEFSLGFSEEEIALAEMQEPQAEDTTGIEEEVTEPAASEESTPDLSSEFGQEVEPEFAITSNEDSYEPALETPEPEPFTSEPIAPETITPEPVAEETSEAEEFLAPETDAEPVPEAAEQEPYQAAAPAQEFVEPEPEFNAEPEVAAADNLQDQAAPTEAADDAAAEDDIAAIDAEDFDSDILEIFLDEANELIEELDESIHSWESDWNNYEAPEAMKRALHTLKGGARLSGVTRLGDLTHDYESYLIATREPSDGFFETVHQYQDTLLNAIKTIRARLDGETASAVDAPAVAPPPVVEDDAVADEPVEAAPAQEEPSSGVVPFAAKAPEQGRDIAEQQQAMMEAAAAKRQGSQEMIKVSAELLEELVNLAGETSISRGRLEQQINDLSSATDEVDATLRRLNEQLRRLDIETEAQVLFRQEQMMQHEQFDPLEMDRYSHLQQLTRSLMESSSDLMDLKLTISDKLRDTETMLLQQQRINSSLQEGLMRSRMVPFSRLVPRLRRIVRQVSGELSKHVNFELDNVEGEMDRSVLERMVAPLEHMLRNAVDHGIESPQDRQNAGKPETGRILLSLAREGGDILLRLADDGKGIDLNRVREKAIERGLMTEDAQLSDHDVMQFILQAGFSTAENVTQISGRGVGMDVVAAEIKQLGGSMMIDSKAGVGTQFVVRLPFTVSVNRALMVQLGNESYAIPLNTIEGIVRVSPFELEHYYTHEEARFEYAGENYQVKYLGTMVTPGLKSKLEGQLLPLPVILVRAGNLTMALQVDALSGSREIVVKSLGPQFAAVQGISGATVMGDGSVVIILDPHALVRKEMAQTGVNLSPIEAHKPDPALTHASAHKTVMVVDDSVTVRKVTTRFLEREGFNVITAKDGVDALQVLQETTPDLMLLDIEMPRMDGFEVAKNMRSTQRWKRTPIIMITSRTGDKHRQHAFSIGVNEYMGKPYQEEALLKTINALLEKQPVSA